MPVYPAMRSSDSKPDVFNTLFDPENLKGDKYMNKNFQVAKSKL